MNIFAIFLGSVFFFWGLVNGYKLSRSLKWFSEQEKNDPLDTQFIAKFIVLIPLLEEQSILHSLLHALQNIEYPPEDYRIVFITTAKERRKMGLQTTEEILQTILPKDFSYIHLHYPRKVGIKSDQLNWALHILDAEGVITSDTIIGVYDADSEIVPKILKTVASKFANQNLNVAQQPTLYLKNWNQIPVLGKGFALLQTLYACGYEIQMWHHADALFPPMRYCVGHGLFVRYNFLKRIGYFPSPIEDTRLGHVCSFLKEPIEIVPIFDSCEVASTAFDRIRQSSVWFSGEVKFICAYSIAAKIKKQNFLFSSWLIFYKSWRTLVWMLKGLFLAGSFIYCLITLNLLFLLIIPCFYLIPLLILIKYKKIIRAIAQNLPPISIGVILLMPIEYILMSFGPWFAVYRYAKSFFFSKDFEYFKTNRY
ncbi:MAG: glycosyltransferase family 2 protein [Patescibacteria group bacterium]|jgi:hypothetical protein